MYGPLTLDEKILAGPWVRGESDAVCFRYSGPDDGPATPVDTSMSVPELCSRYFTDEVWTLLVTETNRHAATL